MAACAATKEAVWLVRLLRELGNKIEKPVPIGEDNNACISIAEGKRVDERTKHVDTQYHYTREKVKDGSIQFERVPTDDMLADAFTKPLSKFKFIKFREDMRLEYSS
jgi:hypothetical protein